jgi:hypothetical protein
VARATSTGRITSPTTAITNATSTTGHQPSKAMPGRIQPASPRPTALASRATTARQTSDRSKPVRTDLPMASPRIADV